MAIMEMHSNIGASLVLRIRLDDAFSEARRAGICEQYSRFHAEAFPDVHQNGVQVRINGAAYGTRDLPDGDERWVAVLFSLKLTL